MSERSIEVFVTKTEMAVEATQVNEYRDVEVHRDKGDPGQAGKSAYQSYVDTTTDNPVMTEAQWANQLGDIQTSLAAL
jgi:hypothetical protein